MTNETIKRNTSRLRNSNLLANGDIDNSDNSGDNSGTGQMSLWNNSFGFNFDSEFAWSPPNSDSGTPDDDSGPNSNETSTSTSQIIGTGLSAHGHPSSSSVQGMTQASVSRNTLHPNSNQILSAPSSKIPSAPTSTNKPSLKSGGSGSDLSNGYNSDDDESRTLPVGKSTTSRKSGTNSSAKIKIDPENDASSTNPRKKHRSGDHDYDDKREERNKREKERSYRITSQINELRSLLSAGGVVVSKGTKNAVLAEAAGYIRLLQQNQYKSEVHRQQLIQQMQLIGTGQLGPQAANAIRYVAAQNGVWPLGNFGGLPPKTFEDPQAIQSDVSEDILMKKIEEHDYKNVFNACSVGMAIASMGGAFIDCNQLFLELSGYSKQEILGLTIFNLTSKEDLQSAFDLISQMISPPLDAESSILAPSCVLRGSMKQRRDLGLNITLIKDDDGIAKCFCVSLIKNPSSPFDDSPPVHATAATLLATPESLKEESKPSSAFRTTG